MATSGTVKTNTKYGSYFWVKWEISGSQDIAGNKTTISWSCGLHPEEQYYTNAIKMGAVVINGQTVYSGGTYSDITDYKDRTFASGTLDIAHNNDGSKTFTVSSFSGWLYGNGDYTASAESFALPAIPRAATITSAPNFTDVDNPAIAYANPAGSAVSALDVCISLTGSASDIAYRAVSTSGGSYTFQLSDAERAVLRNNTNLTRKVVFLLRTKIGSTYYYDTAERTFSVTNNAATRPSEAIAVAPVSALSAPFNALYIQGRTQAKITHTASGKFGAAINQYSADVEGKAYSGKTVTSDALQTPGVLTITGTATDSRGFSATASKTVTVLAYNTPSVVRNGSTGSLVCARSTSGGTISEDGTALYVECSKSFSSLAGNNKCTLRLRYAAEGGGWSSWITLLAESSGNDYAGVVPGVTLSASVVYTIEILAADKLGEGGSVETRIPTSEMTLHLGENGKAVGIGRYASESGENRLDVAWDAHFERGLQTTAVTDLGKTPPKVAVLDNAGWVYYRTPAELRADLGYGDYVLEQGTSGIWTYRKWASGVSECWGNKNCGDIAITSAWGSLFEGSNIGGIAYPSGLFVSHPVFFPSAQTTKYGICGIEIDGGNKTTTPRLYLLRATAQTVQGVYLSLYAKGRWK
jgi:hypothetical protein|nr:MAG TPA: protein of unknown function DUF859 [Caudoviricetes sp.]